MGEIYPRHNSVSATYRFRPKNMETADLPAGAGEMLEREALSIFADVTNANLSFRAALSAILLTGMHWGQAIEQEKQQ